MTEPIWVQKARERQIKVLVLVDRLRQCRSDKAAALAIVLEHYALDRGNMPHKDWVKMRQNLIVKAQQLLGQEEKHD